MQRGGQSRADLNQIMVSAAFSREEIQVQTQTVQSNVHPLYSLYAIYPQAGPSQQITAPEHLLTVCSKSLSFTFI